MKEIIEWFDMEKNPVPYDFGKDVLVSDGENIGAGTFYEHEGEKSFNPCIEFGEQVGGLNTNAWNNPKYWAYLPTGKIKEVKQEYCPNYLDERFDTTID